MFIVLFSAVAVKKEDRRGASKSSVKSLAYQLKRKEQNTSCFIAQDISIHSSKGGLTDSQPRGYGKVEVV